MSRDSTFDVREEAVLEETDDGGFKSYLANEAAPHNYMDQLSQQFEMLDSSVLATPQYLEASLPEEKSWAEKMFSTCGLGWLTATAVMGVRGTYLGRDAAGEGYFGEVAEPPAEAQTTTAAEKGGAKQTNASSSSNTHNSSTNTQSNTHTRGGQQAQAPNFSKTRIMLNRVMNGAEYGVGQGSKVAAVVFAGCAVQGITMRVRGRDDAKNWIPAGAVGGVYLANVAGSGPKGMRLGAGIGLLVASAIAIGVDGLNTSFVDTIKETFSRDDSKYDEENFKSINSDDSE